MSAQRQVCSSLGGISSLSSPRRPPMTSRGSSCPTDPSTATWLPSIPPAPACIVPWPAGAAAATEFLAKPKRRRLAREAGIMAVLKGRPVHCSKKGHGEFTAAFSGYLRMRHRCVKRQTVMTNVQVAVQICDWPLKMTWGQHWSERG